MKCAILNLRLEVMGQKEVGGLDIHMDYRPRTSIMKIHQSFTYAYCYLVSIFPFQHLLSCT
jgi:hypothetical protein